MPYSTKSGVTLYYDIAGSGPSLCLINGYRLSGFAWPPSFISSLATRCTVISFDNRGTGRSDKPIDGYDFASLAKDVVALLDDLDIARVHLLGYSMGGAIAQEVAIRHADRIGQLILFATFCGGIWSEPASYSVFKRLLVQDGQTPEEAARQAWPVTYSPEYLATHAAAVEQQMRRIGAGTLVATGGHDVLVKPRNSAILVSRIPNARLELLADLGHRAIWEAPEEIADFICDFITGPPDRIGCADGRSGMAAQ
jgi:pimeloyl-ACP methyl ester carboxylesterase